MLTLHISQTSARLLRDGSPVPETDQSDIYIETSDKAHSYPLRGLQSHSQELHSILRAEDYQVTYRPYGLSQSFLERGIGHEKVIVEVKTPGTKSLRFSTSYRIIGSPRPRGISSYSYLRWFMPSWSTARKFEWSTHSKLVEPYLTYLRSLKGLIRKRLGGAPQGSDPAASKALKPGNIKPLSKAQEESLTSVIYFHNSNLTLDFGHTFNTIYIEPLGFPSVFTITIEGEYRDAWFSETLTLNSLGVVKLKHPYHKLHNIVAHPSSDFDQNTVGVRVSNYLSLDSFKFHDRLETYLKYSGSQVVLHSKSSHQELSSFKLPINNAGGLFIDSNDHIVVSENSRLFTGKLDAKIHLPIPSDPSYNNSKFIEETKTGPTSYELELFLYDFLQHSKQDLVAVRVETSDGKVKYLDDSLDLVETSEPIYLNSSIAKDYFSLTLTLELNEEYVIIRLEDYDKRFSISHLICQPHIALDLQVDFRTFDPSIPKQKGAVEYVIPIVIEDKVWLWVSYENRAESLWSSYLVAMED